MNDKFAKFNFNFYFWFLNAICFFLLREVAAISGFLGVYATAFENQLRKYQDFKNQYTFASTF